MEKCFFFLEITYNYFKITLIFYSYLFLDCKIVCKNWFSFLLYIYILFKRLLLIYLDVRFVL